MIELTHVWDLYAHQKRQWPGIYRATVTDNADPSGLGRIKVRVHALSDEIELWAMPCVPYSGKQTGFFSLPEPDTNVWVMFEAGDRSYPVWMGCCWGSNEVPPPGEAAVKVWKTEKFTVQIDDNAGEMKMTNDTSTVTIGSDIKSECKPATHTVSSSGVTSEAGAGKVEVASASVVINNGALEVK